MTSAVDIEPFPTTVLTPKNETGVLSFLNKNPTYDGRGTLIAIFDSGVDPAADGLQITTDGKPKVIERFDCSGAGDIDTTAIAIPVNGEITGLSGRILKIPSSFKNPTNTYHIGIRNSFDILPKKRKDFVTKDRKETKWDRCHNELKADCLRKSQEFNNELEKQPEKKAQLPRLDKLKKEDLEAQVEVANTLDKKYPDPGPVYDFVVFHDGTNWRAVADFSEEGNLESCQLLTDFSTDPTSFGTVPGSYPFTYSFNVLDNGKLLEFVICSMSHGTHVASIAAGYFPDEPDKNGIAPGAQIISLQIGDNRIRGQETGTALTRAMIRVMQKCENGERVHVINMSYGETASINTGHIGNMINTLVDKYGVCFVVSAGNEGPALFTVGTPPFISSNAAIGVGAFASPEMMKVNYAMREANPAKCYSWSSRGPTIDGDRGVTICAPGGAIASVPPYMLKSAQLMNGTSMAAPHTTGAIALLISGLLQSDIAYSSYSIKRAIINTAYFQEAYDLFAQGYGLLQVEKAFENLSTYVDQDYYVRYDVTCVNKKKKGIIVRNNEAANHVVSVNPVFFNSKEIDPRIKVEYSKNLMLVSEVPWIKASKFLQMTNTERQFEVFVDPTGLEYGCHASCVLAFDISQPKKGPLFRIDVTVLKYEPLDESLSVPGYYYNDVQFVQNSIRRKFIQVPKNIAYAVVVVEYLKSSKDERAKFSLHCVQILPHRNSRFKKFVNDFILTRGSSNQYVFKVEDGIPMEFTLAKNALCTSEVRVNYKITFGGCRPQNSEFSMHHCCGSYRVDVLPGAINEEVSVSASLKQAVTILKPTSSTIIPLQVSRDIIPPSTPTYQHILTYQFNIPKPVDVTLKSPAFCGLLYESEFQSQMWLLFDHNKRFICAGDAFPERYTTKLEKGEYTVRQQIRHSRRDLLEKGTDLAMLLYQKLPNPIAMDVYTTPTMTNKAPVVKTSYKTEYSMPFYLAPVPIDKLKTITANFFVGSICLSKDEVVKKLVDYELTYYLTDAQKKLQNKVGAEKPSWDDFEEAVKDLHASWITKFDANSEWANKLYDEVRNKYMDHLPSHLAMLTNLEPEDKRFWPNSPKSMYPTFEHLDRIISISIAVINKIDQTEVLAFIGTKNDTTENSKQKSLLDKKKNSLIEAIAKKGCAYAQYYFLSKQPGNEPSDSVSGHKMTITLEDIDAVWLNLIKFVDPGDVKATHYFNVWHAAAFEHYGRLAKYLVKFSEDKSSPAVDACLKWTFDQLKWEHCSDAYKNRAIACFPLEYIPL